MIQSSIAPLPHSADVRNRILGLEKFETESALAGELTVINSLMGFNRFHYIGNFRNRIDGQVRRTVSNLREKCSKEYADAMGDRDPIMEIAQSSAIPVIFRSPDLARVARDASADTEVLRGMSAGVVFPIHTGYCHRGALGVFIEGEHSESDAIISASLGDSALAALYFHSAMNRIIATRECEFEIQLTQRETECLYWISKHKSNWDISKIIGVSEHTIVYYVRRLMRKLHAQNRHEAVERAKAHALF